jgi:hypothetical protein
VLLLKSLLLKSPRVITVYRGVSQRLKRSVKIGDRSVSDRIEMCKDGRRRLLFVKSKQAIIRFQVVSPRNRKSPHLGAFRKLSPCFQSERCVVRAICLFGALAYLW